MAKRAILALLVGALSTPVLAVTPPLMVITQEGPMGIPQNSGWMVWYEDETFEDCAIDLAPDQCTDEWQPALPHFVATEDQCRSIAFDYNQKSREEFQCARERPPAKADDFSARP